MLEFLSTVVNKFQPACPLYMPKIVNFLNWEIAFVEIGNDISFVLEGQDSMDMGYMPLDDS